MSDGNGPDDTAAELPEVREDAVPEQPEAPATGEPAEDEGGEG